MTVNLNELRAQADDVSKRMQSLIDRSNNRAPEERGMTEAEAEEFDRLNDTLTRYKRSIDAAEKLGNGMPAATGRRSGHDDDRQLRDESDTLEVRAWNGSNREFETLTLEEGDARHAIACREYVDAWNGYITENRALNLQQGDQGGYIAPMQVASRFFQKVDDTNWIRRLATNVEVMNAGSLGVFGIDTDPSDATWTSEISDTDATADSSMKFGKRELSPHLLIKRLDISRTMLARLSGAANVVADRLAYVVGRTEEAAFLEGTGANQPLGLFTASDNGISTGRDVVTGSASTFTADGMINAQHNIKGQYRRNASWIFARNAVKKIRKLKDSDGRYLWGRGDLNAGEPDSLLGSPLYEAELAPGHDESNDYDSGDYVGVYGDMSFYQIATAVNLEILRDNLSSAGKNKVRFFVYHEVDAMPILEEAFTRLKIGT